MPRRSHRLIPVLLATGLAAACTDGPTVVGAGGPSLLEVDPQGGQVGVSITTAVTLTFDHRLGPGMEEFVALHEGDVSGPLVTGMWSMSEDRSTLVFEPAEPLEADSRHTVHVGGGMTDQLGAHIDLGTHGPAMGGMWVTETMMTGAMGMGPAGGMMGAGWAHPSDGTFGMIFSFWTGA